MSLMPHQVEGLKLIGRAYKCGCGKEGVGGTQEKYGKIGRWENLGEFLGNSKQNEMDVESGGEM